MPGYAGKNLFSTDLTWSFCRMQTKKRPALFYGWWILIACFIMATYSSGVIYYGFTALFEPVVKEFGWSYAEVSIASSLRGLEIGLFAPVVGYLVDRFGARPVLFIGGIFSGRRVCSCAPGVVSRRTPSPES